MNDGYFCVLKIFLKPALKLSLCLTKDHAMKTYWWSGRIAPLIPYIDTRWTWMVSFMLPSLYCRGVGPVILWTESFVC